MLNNNKICVIGSGVSGLCSAIELADKGMDVHVFEKNKEIGGRARKFSSDGFTFDMGPSWYWMPDVFENFFKRFEKNLYDYVNLVKLNPGFQIIYNNETIQIPEKFEDLVLLFEEIEKGAGNKLIAFIKEAETKYIISMKDLVFNPSLSIKEFIRADVIKAAFKLHLFSSFKTHVNKYFKHPKLLSIMEFPILFLGAQPKDTPALYSLMNYSGLKQGTFYPMGGFSKVIDAFYSLAIEKGVTFHLDTAVTNLHLIGNNISHIETSKGQFDVDKVLSSADYHHTEQSLLPLEKRTYSEKYWKSRTFAPSSLIFYLGINKKIQNLEHHNLFFDEDIQKHAAEIYQDPKWPTKPLFYVCCPSKTDESTAPVGMENIFILMPIATDLLDTEEIRDKYFKLILNRIQKYVGEDISQAIVFKRSYCVADFKSDYNAYKGNAYGLANTLKQTAFLKPKIKSKKVENLYYTGQLTVPGPGVPPSIISGQLVANQLIKDIKEHETVI